MDKKRKITNAVFAKSNKRFIAACQRAGIEPSKRQASKYRRQRGLAWEAK